MPKKILISNDDGIDSPGLEALAKVAAIFGEVTVVAPHRERSTSGHSLTLHKPLRIQELAPSRFAVTGSPVDCIYLGIREILGQRPDLILSGINYGANLGNDIHYSGTVAAAREGALMNIPSIAFSLVMDAVKGYPHGPANFEKALPWVEKVLEFSESVPFPSHTLLNVNIPNFGEIKGMEITTQGVRYYSDLVTRGTDPRGKSYYWIGGAYERFEPIDGSDCLLTNEGLVTITPINLDCTHKEFYAHLKRELSLS